MINKNRFQKLWARQEHVFMPFFTLGDPNFENSFEIIKAAIEAGADCLELGIPFSDPIADGPTNQRSMARALKSGMNFERVLALLTKIRALSSEIPIGLLLYYNVIYHRGLELSLSQLAIAGVDAIVCGDLPIEEGKLFDQACERYGISPVYMVAPNTPDERVKEIFKRSPAYTYVQSGLGVTGVKESVAPGTIEHVGHIKELVSPLSASFKMIVGFGISKPEQVKQIWSAGADGAIVGSYFSQVIEKNLEDLNLAKKIIQEFVRECHQSC